MAISPATLEEAMKDSLVGRRWVVISHHSASKCVPDQEGRYLPGPADFYEVVHCRNWGIRRRAFRSEAKATAYADELNRLDFQGPIPPEFAERRKRLKELAPCFNSWAYTSEEGPSQARWPVNPDRYLVMDAGVGWHAESWEHLVPDKAAIEEKLKEEEANIYRIVDLDTGEDVPFTREIVLTVELDE